MERSEFEQIARQLREQMLKVALDFFGSQDDAEDVAQDAMLLLWRYCEHIDSSRNVSGLAIRVAKNCCVSRYRRRKHEYCVDSMPDISDAQCEPLESEDARLLMNAVMARLKPRERELFEMRQLDGLSTKEISVQTGIPQKSVSAMVSAARMKLFLELKKRMGR